MLNIARSLFFKRAILLPLYTFSSYFSGQTKEQKELAAKEAAQIIRFLGKDRQQISLDNFIPLTAAIKTKLNIQSKLINDMLDPRIGIILPDHLQTQARITDAFNISSTRDLKGFTFFPNRIVTSQIFQQILFQTSQKLIHGPAGSSKTVAFTFFTYLSQIINEYEFQFDEVVAQDIPRMFYLNYKNFKKTDQIITSKSSLNKKKKNIQEHIVKYMKLNLPKKLSDKFEKIKKVEQLTYKINEYFIEKKKLQIKFVFDQFNKYISQVRQYNSSVLFQNKPNVALQFQKKKLSFDSAIWFEIASSLCNDKVFYNSSQNIQDKLLKKIPLPQFSFSIYTHTPLHKEQISFYQQIQLPSGKREMVSILFFELKRLCPSEHLQKITSIEKIFFKNFDENLKDVSKEIIFTHFQIREYLKMNIKTLKFLRSEQDLNNEEIVKQIKFIINKIFILNRMNLVQQLKNFCFKANQSVSIKTYKIKFLMAVRTILQRRLRNPVSGKGSQKVKNVNQLTIQQIKYELGVDQKMYKIDTVTIDKNLFQFDCFQGEDYNNWVRIKWSPKYFLELTNFVEEALKKIISQNTEIFLNTFFKYFKNYNSVVDQFLDYKITESIEQQPIKLSYRGQFMQISYQIQKSLRFLHFNAYPLFQGLQQRLKQFISESNKHSFIAGIPQTNNHQKSKYSKAIDLLIFTKYSNQIKEIEEIEVGYRIDTFDFTVMDSQITLKNPKFASSTETIKKIYENYYGIMEKKINPDTGLRYELDENQQRIKKNLQEQLKKNPQKPKIKIWVHTIVCKQPQYYSKNFEVKIPYSSQHAIITIQTTNIQNFIIEFLNKQSSLAMQNSGIIQRTLRQIRNLRVPQS